MRSMFAVVAIAMKQQLVASPRLHFVHWKKWARGQLGNRYWVVGYLSVGWHWHRFFGSRSQMQIFLCDESATKKKETDAWKAASLFNVMRSMGLGSGKASEADIGSEQRTNMQLTEVDARSLVAIWLAKCTRLAMTDEGVGCVLFKICKMCERFRWDMIF